MLYTVSSRSQANGTNQQYARFFPKNTKYECLLVQQKQTNLPYVETDYLKMDNNDVERIVRSAAFGRKTTYSPAQTEVATPWRYSTD